MIRLRLTSELYQLMARGLLPHLYDRLIYLAKGGFNEQCERRP